ncbi:unnamed protein product [Ilex paraguariensis]|uniref:VQ domain-containing protein n=1 Tax=Ilex paraguariensis TaxID=185542 RepID=A0ABC8RV67_9AQUA
MEGLMKKEACVSKTTSSPLSVHKDSQTISKAKPKIRIIHIFAPEIIKTDVANFRELVQRLTGKPTENSSTKKKTKHTRKEEPIRTLPHKPVAKKMELRSGFHFPQFRERIKGEEEIWGGANSGGGFLGGFADLDGFMQEFNGFPLLPLDSSHMETYGESQLA